MGCPPGQVQGPSAIPFWPTCYEINSDMGSYLLDKIRGRPTFQAEMSDINIVFSKFGTPPATVAGREKLAVEGPDLWQQLQASLAALHPLLGKDEVATAMREEGLKLLATVRHATPDAGALQDAMRKKLGEAGARYSPEMMETFFNEERKEKTLGLVSALVAPLAAKYGGLGRALGSSVKAGAFAGATVILYAMWQNWVQGRLGEIQNELHATSGSLVDKARPAPWEEYASGDWVFMRELRGKIWTPRIGCVLGEKKKTGRWKRYAVAALPEGTIFGREAGDMQFMDQVEVNRALQVDPKLRVWRTAMAVKHSVQQLVGCRRRLVAAAPGASTCSYGPIRRVVRGVHEHVAPPPAAPPLPEVTEAQWIKQEQDHEKTRLDSWRKHLEDEKEAGRPVAADRQKFLQALNDFERRNFELYSMRAQAEQQDYRNLAGRGIRQLGAASNIYAYVDAHIVKITHIDEAADYWYRTLAGGLQQLPEGQMTVDRDIATFPPEWTLPVVEEAEDTGSEISEMDLHEGGPDPPYDHNPISKTYTLYLVVVLLAMGILLVLF